MQSLIKSTPATRSRVSLLFVCAALMSAVPLVSGCDDDEDPLGVAFNPADAGGNGTATPGGGTTGGGSSSPLDAGFPPTSADAAVGPGADTGIMVVGGGQDAASDASGGPLGTPGDAAVASDASGGDASATPPRADLGKGDGSDVLMIGDSWMSLGGAESGIQGGVLKASMQPYRAVAIPGTTLLGGGIIDLITGPVPTQYEQAIQADANVKTVIMTAGGNDILQTGLEDDCNMDGEACGEQVTKILDGLTKLWTEMAGDGVQDIVYILYATPAGKSVDFLLPDGDGAKQRCANVPAPARCHIVETLELVMGDIPDGIHPSQPASDRIGKAVVEMMAARGMRR